MKLFFNLFFLFQFLFVFSQKNDQKFIHYIDAGEKIIEISPLDAYKYLDSTKIVISSIQNEKLLLKYAVFEAGIFIKKKDYQKALTLLNRLKSKENKIDSKSKLLLLRRLAKVNENLDNLTNSWNYWQVAEQFAEKQKDSVGLSQVLLKMGDYVYYHANPQQSVNYYFKALKVSEKIHFAPVEAEALASIGYIYEANKQLDKANQFYQKSLAIAKKNGDNKNAVNVLSYLSSLYGDQLKNIKKALYYIHEREKLLINTTLNNEIYRLYADYALIYFSSNDFEKALTYYQKSLIYAKKSDAIMEISRTHYNMGLAYKKLKDYKNAQIQYDSAVFLGLKHNDLNRLWYAYYDLAYLNSEKKDYKQAFSYFEKYADVNEQILNKNHQANLNELNIKYETEKKENQNKLLQKDNTIKKVALEKKRKQNLYLWIILGLIALLLGIGTFAFIRLKKQHKILKIQRDEIEEKTLQLNKQALEISKFRTQMNPHFIFNALNSVQHFILKENKNNALGYLHDLSRLMRITLYNSDKEFISLKEEYDFISFYVHFEQQRFDKKIAFDWNVDNEIDRENTLIIPMLIQPFLENSFKHGGFSQIEKPKISVIICQENNLLKIEIEDNGVGIKSGSVNNLHESKGIEITRKRIETLFNKNPISISNDLLKIINKSEIDTNQTGYKVVIYLPFVELF